MPSSKGFNQQIFTDAAIGTVIMYLLTLARIYIALSNGQSISTEGGALSYQTQKVQEVFLCPYKKKQATTIDNGDNSHANNDLKRGKKALLIEFVTFATSGFLLLAAHLAFKWWFGKNHREYMLMLTTFCSVSTLHVFLPLFCFIYRPHNQEP